MFYLYGQVQSGDVWHKDKTMIKIITTELKNEGLTVNLSFSIIDDVTPGVILDSLQTVLTVPNGLTNAQIRAFLANESLKIVQVFYNQWKVKSEKQSVNDANKQSLETYINANLVI